MGHELSENRNFAAADYADCPVKLGGLLVQEDFILLSPATDEGEPSRFVAGCACFLHGDRHQREERTQETGGIPRMHPHSGP